MTPRISVFGLGYVGCVSAACLAREGFNVIGVDVNAAKVEMIGGGESTIVEEGIAEIVRETHASGRLQASTDAMEAVHATDISLICVGTPSRLNGSIDLSYVQRVCQQIGQALRDKQTHHTLVIRSTVLPGTIDETVIPTVEAASGKSHGVGFAVCSNPEFLREGTSIKDFYDPPFTLIGVHHPDHAGPVRQLYASIAAPLHLTSVRVAEMVKYVSNCFHGLKVGFANEIGNLCKALEIDSHEVMRLFCEDRKLNISPAYLKPGFAFGGSCLPKDLRAVVHKAKQLDLESPVLNATLETNERQIDRAFNMVMASGSRRIGVLGLAFKPGTDDLRESPMVTLVERLIGKGKKLAIYDNHVSHSRVMGANREYVEREIPHIWELMHPSLESVLENAETLVVGNRSPEFQGILERLRAEQVIIDLARVVSSPRLNGGSYQGICW